MADKKLRENIIGLPIFSLFDVWDQLVSNDPCLSDPVSVAI